MKLHGKHYIPNVCRNFIAEVDLETPTFDYEGPGVDLHLGQGRELKFQCTDVCCPEEYPVARQGHSVITFDGSEYIGDVIRRFIEYKASKGVYEQV